MKKNLLSIAKENSISALRTGKAYKKEELADRKLTINSVDIDTSPAYDNENNPIIDENGRPVMNEYAVMRFDEITDGHFLCFGLLTETVKKWRDEYAGDLDALNADLMEEPRLNITIQKPARGRAWKYTVT